MTKSRTKKADLTWDLSPLLSGDNDPTILQKRAELQKQAQSFIKKWKPRRDYLKDPKILKQALDHYQRWLKNYGSYGDEGYYFSLRTAQDENDPKLKAKFNQISELGNRISAEMEFFELRLARISKKYQIKFLRSPILKRYQHFLERSFAWAKYLLSEKEERILTLKAPVCHGNWVRMVSGFLSKQEAVVLGENGRQSKQSFSQILNLLNSQKKEVRDRAARAFNKILKENLAPAEAELNSILQNKKIEDEIRKIKRPDLPRHIGDDIETGVVDAMLKAVEERYDMARRYYQLKAKLMKVKKLKYHERNVPIGKVAKRYSWPEAVKLVSKVLHNLDPEFKQYFQGYIKNRQIDLFPRKNKTSVVFSAYNRINQPTYILMNYSNKLQEVLTLAHEFGHGVNNEFVKQKQTAIYFGTPTSTAEVASTFFEDFVLAEIAKGADKQLHLGLNMMKLNEDVGSIFRQVAFYRFEQELHQLFRKKGYLSQEEIGKLFRKQTEAYMGDYVEQSKGAENWWVYVSHFRRFFYVYSYASGLLISKALQNKVKHNAAFIKEFKRFLQTGLSASPQKIFKQMGLDITQPVFWQEGLKEVEQLLEETEALT